MKDPYDQRRCSHRVKFSETCDRCQVADLRARLAACEKERDEAVQTAARIASERACEMIRADTAERERDELREIEQMREYGNAHPSPFTRLTMRAVQAEQERDAARAEAAASADATRASIVAWLRKKAALSEKHGGVMAFAAGVTTSFADAIERREDEKR